jgi:hypothetical protein
VVGFSQALPSASAHFDSGWYVFARDFIVGLYARNLAGAVARSGGCGRGASGPELGDMISDHGSDNLHPFADVCLAIDFFDIMVAEPDAAMGHAPPILWGAFVP